MLCAGNFKLLIVVRNFRKKMVLSPIFDISAAISVYLVAF